jgi:hypothetical protein
MMAQKTIFGENANPDVLKKVMDKLKGETDGEKGK